MQAEAKAVRSRAAIKEEGTQQWAGQWVAEGGRCSRSSAQSPASRARRAFPGAASRPASSRSSEVLVSSRRHRSQVGAGFERAARAEWGGERER